MPNDTDHAFAPSRGAALIRLAEFAPHMGATYTRRRNFDLGPGRHTGVSMLSPYLRHRVISEREVVQTTLKTHSYSASEKFIQEVFWRTYWKGWLERRPEIWRRYCADVDQLFDQTDEAYLSAARGQTGIDCFDQWVAELTATGYLHNHARMWFASIWIFTLKLPWQLGANFFLQHLLDGDAASNTLSWRWVAGLQTKGKTYLALADNIEKFTEGRFKPAVGLAPKAEPLDDHIPAANPSPTSEQIPDGPVTLLITDDCLSPLDHLPPSVDVQKAILLQSVQNRAFGGVSHQVTEFTEALQTDAAARLAGKGIESCVLQAGESPPTDFADPGTDLIAVYPTLGAGQQALEQFEHTAGQTVRRILPDWDMACYPHCKRGFFPFKKEIPSLLDALM